MTFRPAFKARFSRQVSIDGGDGGGDGVMAAVDVRVAAGSGRVGTVMGKGRGAGIDTERGGDGERLGRAKLAMMMKTRTAQPRFIRPRFQIWNSGQPCCAYSVRFCAFSIELKIFLPFSP